MLIPNLFHPPSPMINNVPLETMFEYVVEDPFYSKMYGSIVTVTDREIVVRSDGEKVANVTPVVLMILYSEWYYEQGF
jgi:hypothetical protein